MGRLMRILYLCTILACISIGSLAKKKKKLEVITESMPEDCTEFADIGDTITVHYTGSLENGEVFDTSRKEGREPFSIKLGAGQVIKGWDDGLVGACVGEVRKLIIPSQLAYGDRGVPGVIPGGATLVFSVELLEVQKKPLIPLPQGTGFWTYIGLLVLVVGLGYELYRRATKQTEEVKKQKKSRDREHPVRKGQSKKKK